MFKTLPIYSCLLCLIVDFCEVAANSDPWKYSLTRFKTVHGKTCKTPCEKSSDNKYYCFSNREVTDPGPFPQIQYQLQPCSPEPGQTINGSKCFTDCKSRKWGNPTCYTDANKNSWDYCTFTTHSLDLEKSIIEEPLFWTDFKTTLGHPCHSPCKMGVDGKHFCVKSYSPDKVTERCSPRPKVTYKGVACTSPCEFHSSVLGSYYWCYTDFKNWDYCGKTSATFYEVMNRNYSVVNVEATGDSCSTNCKQFYKDKGSYYCWISDVLGDLRRFRHRCCSPESGLASGENCNSHCFEYGDSYMCVTNATFNLMWAKEKGKSDQSMEDIISGN